MSQTETEGASQSGGDRDKTAIAPSNREPAEVVYDSDGEPMGVAVFLHLGDLRALGIDPTDVSALQPGIVGGDFHLVPVR